MTTYSITLDDVDLTFLPLRTRTHNSFLKKELYQFEVIKSAPQPTTLYTCHICAIEVPITFANGHAASVKHRANVRIASVAAERMRAFISALPPPYAEKPYTRFCENCATGVEEGHDTTKEHRAAVALDGQLWNLMKAYVHDDDDESKYNQYRNNGKEKVNDNIMYDEHFKTVDGDNNKNTIDDLGINIEPTIEDKAEVTCENEQIEENCETNTENSEYEEVNKSTDESESIGSINVETPINVAKNNMVDQGTNVNWVEHYEEELRQFINDNDYFEYKESSYNISIKLNEYTLCNIESRHFHSYQKINSSDNIKCLVCDFVLDRHEAEIHKDDFEHMRRVAKFGKYGHFVREIDQFYSHCIVCNEKMKNVEVLTHIQSLTHTIQELCFTNTRGVNETQTKDRTTENKHSASANKEHTSIITNKIIDAQDISNNGLQIEYPYEVTATGNVLCMVCECQVPRGVNNREQHVKGLRHRTLVFHKKRTTKPIEHKYGEELCKFVDERYYFDFKEITWDTFRLQLDDNILEAYTNRFHSFHPVDNDRLKCQVCDCVFRCENEEEHKYDLNHLRVVANLGNDGHFVRKINILYSHCILCNDMMFNINVAKHKRSHDHEEVKKVLVKSSTAGAGIDSE